MTVAVELPSNVFGAQLSKDPQVFERDEYLVQAGGFLVLSTEQEVQQILLSKLANYFQDRILSKKFWIVTPRCWRELSKWVKEREERALD